MSSLTNQQLRLMSAINKIRLAVIEQFKNHINPYPAKLFQQLLKLEVLLMENKYKENLSEFLDENHKNLSVLVQNMFVKNHPSQKLKIKWGQKKEKQEKIPKQQRQFKRDDIKDRQNITQTKQQYKHAKQPLSKAPQIPSIFKGIIPAGEFMSANTLPKGTSVRKKFVPPYKKSQALQELTEKQEEEQKKDPAYKNLDQKLISIIQSEILEKGDQVKWSQIAGLGFAKKIIHQMIVWPMQRPDIFTGMRAPPRAILLFGPPGTGKTMIGKAIASEAAATFFSISASSLTSKWVGQSQKLVKTLFSIARLKQPSVIFIDEIDSLLCARSQGEQQSSRRVKTQFLIELDGAKTNSNERVLIIGATNLPKELDDAVRRRFVKRLYIPLPNTDGRIQLIKSLTNNTAFRLEQHELRTLAIKTKGFSGADLYTLCSQASMIPLRQMTSIENVRQSEVPFSELRHFEQAFKLVRPSVNKKLLRSFQQFNQQYGSYQLTPDQLQNEEQVHCKKEQ